MRPIGLAVLLPLLAACGGNPPEWRNDRFELTGEFRADGTCSLSLDGERLLGDSVRGVARVTWDTVSGGRNVGWHHWTIWCQHSGHSTELLITADHPRERPLARATYPLLRNGERAGPPFIEVTLWEPRFDTQGRWGATLGAYDGSLTVDSIDDTLLVGAFRFVARRYGDTPFE
jgi:hypothetical protein